MHDKKTTKLNNLVKFLYKETSINETLEVSCSIREDKTQKAIIKSLEFAKNSIPDILFSPRKDIINNILDYSASSARFEV